MNCTDHIRLTGIEGFGHHGVLPEERRDGQKFIVDVTLWLDLTPAAATDDLHDTVNYAEIAQMVVAEIEGEPVNLIESLAERIADKCVNTRKVRNVEVTVHKPSAPIPVPFADVAVTIQRSLR